MGNRVSSRKPYPQRLPPYTFCGAIVRRIAVEFVSFVKTISIVVKVISVIKSLFHRIRYGAPMKLYLRKFEESVSRNNINFEIESTTENSLYNHLFLNYVFARKKVSIKLPITPEDKSLQPYKVKQFAVDCSNIGNFQSLLFKKYEIRSINGPSKTLYFRRAANLEGSKMSALRYHFELCRYRLFGKIKDKHTTNT